MVSADLEALGLDVRSGSSWHLGKLIIAPCRDRSVENFQRRGL